MYSTDEVITKLLLTLCLFNRGPLTDRGNLPSKTPAGSYQGG